jgi:NADPH-dependent 2,4-dienoyl-CoA reductase/sulfur reductase-like enzyme
VVTKEGLLIVKAKSVILATGCRERTFRQIFIQGDRPSGIYCAGTAQHLVNRMGHLPGKRVVILGSGDIGLIMARRLTLEGAKVIGVYEIKSTPSGLDRNINQCLTDFNIPLYLSTSVTKCYGKDRLTKVQISKVDKNLRPIKGTEEIIDCDTLIVSVGLIPEIDLLDDLKPLVDNGTKGLKTDQNGESTIPGLFTCGNCSVVYDLVDYVTLQSEVVGKSAALYSKEIKERVLINIEKEGSTFLVSPSVIDLNGNEIINLVLRVDKNIDDGEIIIKQDNNIIYQKNYSTLKTPHMELIKLNKNIILSRADIVVYSGKRRVDK